MLKRKKKGKILPLVAFPSRNHSNAITISPHSFLFSHHQNAEVVDGHIFQGKINFLFLALLQPDTYSARQAIFKTLLQILTIYLDKLNCNLLCITFYKDEYAEELFQLHFYH